MTQQDAVDTGMPHDEQVALGFFDEFIEGHPEPVIPVVGSYCLIVKT